MNQPKHTKLLLISIVLSVAMMSLSFPLACISKALLWGGAAAVDGAFFGAFLAGATRTRRVPFIYLNLVGAGIMLWLLTVITDVELTRYLTVPRGWHDLFSNYLDVLRFALFIIWSVYPFARLGWHKPDTDASSL